MLKLLRLCFKVCHGNPDSVSFKEIACRPHAVGSKFVAQYCEQITEEASLDPCWGPFEGSVFIFISANTRLIVFFWGLSFGLLFIFLLFFSVSANPRRTQEIWGDSDSDGVIYSVLLHDPISLTVKENKQHTLCFVVIVWRIMLAIKGLSAWLHKYDQQIQRFCQFFTNHVPGLSWPPAGSLTGDLYFLSLKL